MRCYVKLVEESKHRIRFFFGIQLQQRGLILRFVNL